MKRLIIVMCLILLCACAKNESNQIEQVQQQVSSTTPQPITEINEAPSITPSTSEQSTLPIEAKEEVSQPKEKIKEPLSLDGWIVGQAFTDVKNRIPKSATIDYDPLWGEYSVSFEQVSLSFDEAGRLSFVLISIPGKGLSNNLNVGDSDSKITEILGEPKDYSKNVDYNFYLYELSQTRVDIYTKNDKVDDIRLLYTGQNTVNDADSIKGYYQQKTQVSIKPEPTPITPRAPENAPAQQEEPKTITFDEYVKISEDVLNALVQYTQIMSKDIADDEKLKKIEEIDSKYKIYDLSVTFENAVPSDEKDNKLHIRCKNFVEKVDSLFGTGMFYLNLKMKEDDEKTIADWKKQASKELQEVWAWVNQR